MPVGNINTAKELVIGYKPLLLAVITFTDSIGSPTKRRYASSGLNTADGSFVPVISGFPETGQSFLTRIKNSEIAATQALSEQGIDVTPTVTLELSDVDKALWVDEKNLGHKGADLTLYFVFWNVGQNDFSSDYFLIFSGVCGPGSVSEKTLSVSAVSRSNLAQKYLPTFHVQRRCSHIFPDTTLLNTTEATALHQQVADDPSHPSYACHYSVLASGSGARGNMNGGSHYQSCGQTFEQCIERMGNSALVAPPFAPIEKDTSGRFTGTFSGVRWDQPAKFQSRGYAEKASIEGLNSVNEAKYNDLVPMGWGTFWVDPVILNVVGDANFTRFEALVGVGEYSSLRKVIVNDIEIDKWGTSTDQQNQQISLQMHWREWNTGSVFGRVNGDTVYDFNGDPYGSQKVISVTIPRKLNPSSSIPRVRILADGPKTRKYQSISSISVSGGVATATLVGINRDIAGNGTFNFTIAGSSKSDVNGSYTSLTNWTYGPPGTIQFPTGASNGSGTGGYIRYEQVNTNPAWIILDALTWLDYKYSRIDLDSFMAAAAFYDENINYTDQYGVTNSHARFKLSLGLRQRTVGSDLIRQLRTSCRSTLVPHPTTGALQLMPDRTLASQQPSAVAGSNYNISVKSVNEAGTVTPGYVAYKFSYSTIAQSNAQGDSSFSMEQLPIQSTPNRVSFPFADEDNSFQSDSLTLVDAEDIRRSGQEVNGSIPVIGIMNFDQAARTAAHWMAIKSRGNNRGDTGGTYQFSLETTYRCVHLRLGHIVLVDYPQYGLNAGIESPAGTAINGFLARVMSIKPSANFERVKLVLQYHVDAHYLDSWGQSAAPRYSGLRRDRLSRPALPWLPYEQQPEASSSLFPVTEWGFSIAADYSVGANLEPQAKLIARGKMPVNSLAPSSLSPPAVGSQGTTASTGGTITGNQKIWAQISVEDSDGLSSAPSDSDTACEIDIPSGTNTNTITIPVLQWDYPEGTNYTLFAGNSRSKLSQQATGAVTSDTTPASITLSSLNEATWGMPDVEFDSAILRGKVCVRAGLIGAEVLSVTSNTIQMSLFTDNPLTVNQFQPVSGKYYHIILVGMDQDYPLPLASWSINSNTGDTFTVTGPDCTTIPRGDGTLGMQAGDVVVVTMRPTVGSDADGNYIEDLNWVNALNPLLTSHEIVGASNSTPIVISTTDSHGLVSGQKVFQKDVEGNVAANGVFWVSVLTDNTFELYSNASLITPVAGVADWISGGTVQRQLEGLTVDSDIGYELYCIKGTGAGNWYKIKKNSSTRIWIEGSWNVTPDETSVFVVNNSGWNFNVPTETLNNTVNTTPLTFTMDIPNYLGQVLFVQGFTRDGGGNEPHRAMCPWRLIYVYGRTNTTLSNNDGYYEMETIAGEVTPDLANGLSQQESATGNVLVNNPVNSAGAIVAGMRLYIKIVQDATGYRQVTWGSEFVGFADGTEDPVQDPNTYSWYEFVRTNAGKWELRNSSKGRPIS